MRTLRDYFKPIHEGYQNTIELPVGNNTVPLRSDTVRLVQNRCSFHGLRSEDPNQYLNDFLKLVDSLNLDVTNRKRTRSIFTWEDLTTRFLAQFFPPGRTAKLRDDILMFQKHQGESLSEAFKAISTSQRTLKTPDRRLLELEDHINFLLKGPQPAPRESSTHVPQIYDEAVSSNPHPRNLDEPPREEVGHPVTKHVNSISLIRGEEENSAEDKAIFGNSIVKPDRSDAVVPLKEVEKENEPENGTKNKPVESAEKKLT
nr:zinc finger, CCHC-type [Tanacetum cinerariifolium]